jgi:hypothetical protein
MLAALRGSHCFGSCHGHNTEDRIALVAATGTTQLKHFIQRQRAEAYASFAGATLQGSIPFTEHVINNLLQASNVGRSTTIRQLHVNLCEQNHIVVTGTLHKWFLAKRFEVELWVEPEIDWLRAPRLRIWLPRSSLFGSVGHLLTTFGLWLPRSIYITGRLIEVDLAEVLFEYDLPELVYWTKFVQLVVVRGGLILSFVAHIDIPPLPTKG